MRLCHGLPARTHTCWASHCSAQAGALASCAVALGPQACQPETGHGCKILDYPLKAASPASKVHDVRPAQLKG